MVGVMNQMLVFLVVGFMLDLRVDKVNEFKS